MFGLGAYGSGSDSDDQEPEAQSAADEINETQEVAAAPSFSLGSLLPKSKTQMEKEKKEKERKEKKKLKKLKKKAKKEQERKAAEAAAAKVAEEAKTVEGAAKAQLARIKGVSMMRRINCAPSLQTKKKEAAKGGDSGDSGDKANSNASAADDVQVVQVVQGVGMAGAAFASTKLAAKGPGVVPVYDKRRRGYHVGEQEAMGGFSLFQAAPPPVEHEAPLSHANMTHIMHGGRVVPMPSAVKGYASASPEAIQAFEESQRQGPHFHNYEQSPTEHDIPDELLGRNEKLQGIRIIDINAAELCKKTFEEERAAQIEAANPSSEIETTVNASFWSSKAGGTVNTNEVGKIHKRKHQINQLARDSAVMEHELSKKRALGSDRRQMARAKYGW